MPVRVTFLFLLVLSGCTRSPPPSDAAPMAPLPLSPEELLWQAEGPLPTDSVTAWLGTLAPHDKRHVFHLGGNRMVNDSLDLDLDGSADLLLYQCGSCCCAGEAYLARGELFQPVGPVALSGFPSFATCRRSGGSSYHVAVTDLYLDSLSVAIEVVGPDSVSQIASLRVPAPRTPGEVKAIVELVAEHGPSCAKVREEVERWL